MLEFGCTGLRWARRYRDLRGASRDSPRGASDVEGAGCDCEIFMNGWSLRREYKIYDPECEEYEYLEERPECKGVRTGSVQPCGLWVVQSRQDW